MKALIKSIYTTDQEGNEFITKNGHFYVKLLLSLEGEESLYESIFLTPKAHWRVESLYESANRVPPSANELEISHFNELIGETIDVAVGVNDGGYKCVKKFYPSKKAKQVAVTESAPSAVVGQPTDTTELDEDVPF